VLKPYAERYLMEVPRTAAAFIEATRLYQFLQLFIPVQAEEVPYTSVLREFIGGSTFRY
jgi:uridine kinase